MIEQGAKGSREAFRRLLHVHGVGAPDSDQLQPLFQPLRLHLLLLEEENAHVQYAAIRGIQVYGVDETFTREYRRRVLTLYGDWHSWW